ncbi:zinc finger protein ZAT11-like [Hibiscus syriacus]|uniref:Zinc finger protein ZAT11-like n=1 Tax=Hibiscus syriacus TaxID=106335 RepID=A0A6A2Z9R7_HIBSY|nr:zinc finger protein ZAT11-like [Hibiscus syriacus]
MAKGTAHVSDGDAAFDNTSRVEPKRSHNWFVDAEPQLFPNKKQAIQAATNKSNSGIYNSNVLPWENVSSFQSVPSQFMYRLFGSESERSVNFSDRNTSPIEADDARRKGLEDPFGEVASVGLSISPSIEDPESCFNYGGIRKVKVNQVKDSDNLIMLQQGCQFLSFGGFHEEHEIIPVSRTLGSFDPSYCQSSNSTLEDTSRNQLGISISGSVASAAQTAKLRPESASRTKPEFKPSKKEAPNSFPSNVRSLISTGMLGGVPVKYVSLLREELCGVIKGSGYLCGCQSCNFSNVLNAYEFEHHAGCKTKHPNNHIYFDTGKTIYQIVQELRRTPESLLFDTIPTVFSAPINQKSFRIWKESFQAATRELQRIYGKELNL